jgi:hypothetical protein
MAKGPSHRIWDLFFGQELDLVLPVRWVRDSVKTFDECLSHWADGRCSLLQLGLRKLRLDLVPRFYNSHIYVERRYLLF